MKLTLRIAALTIVCMSLSQTALAASYSAEDQEQLTLECLLTNNKYASAFIALVMVLFLALFLFVPSMDEIQQRRSEVNNLKQYSLDISKCEGQTCVKVMKKQCGYGKNGDYCVIDPK